MKKLLAILTFLLTTSFALGGAPDSGAQSKGIEGAGKIPTTKFERDDFQAYLQAYCMQFEMVTNPYAFRKEILGSMRATPYSFEHFWTQAECRPTKMGATLSPLAHLAAEEAVDRKRWLEILQKEIKDPDQWSRVINAKNTRGQTLLDYIAYLGRDKQYRKYEIEDVNLLIEWLCEKGATFAVEKALRCPFRL